MADAAAGVRDVTGVAWDDVEVELRNGLAGGEAVVQAEVEGVGLRVQLGSEVLLDPVDPDEQSGFFRGSQLLKASRGPTSNDQCVAGRDGELVGDDGKQFIGRKEASGFDFTKSGKLQRRSQLLSGGFHAGFLSSGYSGSERKGNGCWASAGWFGSVAATHEG
jgi:hypothetical protein